MTECAIEGCGNPIEAKYRKLCGGHRARLKRTGETGSVELRKPTPPGLSHAGVLLFNGWTVTESGCWEYDGPRFARGYGQVKAMGTNPKLAHRVSYEHFKGDIPEELLIRHTCDNPPCINPDHLLTGTSKDNAQDRESRNRGQWRNHKKA